MDYKPFDTKLKGFGDDISVDSNTVSFNDIKDPVSARSINRPTRKLFEDASVMDDIFQHMSVTLLQTKDPSYFNIYEGFAVNKFKVFEISNKKYLRIPFGVIWTRHDNLPIFINKPNVELMERQIADTFYIDLNERYNDVSIDYDYDDSGIYYTCTITKSIYDAKKKVIIPESIILGDDTNDRIRDQLDLLNKIQSSEFGKYYNDYKSRISEFKLETWVEITNKQSNLQYLYYNKNTGILELGPATWINSRTYEVPLLSVTFDNLTSNINVTEVGYASEFDYESLKLSNLYVTENTVTKQWVTTDDINSLITGETS